MEATLVSCVKQSCGNNFTQQNCYVSAYNYFIHVNDVIILLAMKTRTMKNIRLLLRSAYAINTKSRQICDIFLISSGCILPLQKYVQNEIINSFQNCLV